ncbi:lipothrixviral glycosyltransferase [Sulfolobus islandicus filamentous virus 2]|uniref:Lipothrixviral glycosyltransferase n=1 Tax=Sulfolobus islandicus filamentous virus 2 TaxID=1902331 RepID=A0A1D8BJ98_SIFV|nr:lipothrixviral glycosyltransferase [Sulfolobus islandicus filamentous virus 2]
MWLLSLGKTIFGYSSYLLTDIIIYHIVINNKWIQYFLGIRLIKAYVPCEKCSYEKVAEYENFKITHNLFDADVCIDDPVLFLKRIKGLEDEVTCLLWGDTVYDALYYKNEMAKYDNITMASYWNYGMFSRIGYKIKGVMKRHIKPIFVEEKKDKLFITLGESRYFDRKNLTLADRITREFGVRDKTIIVGNLGNPDYLTFQLTEEEKYRLYARSKFFLALSKSEGFGIPPIEAMALGVVPIYLNAHGYKENLVGIPIDPIDEYTYCPDDKNCFRVWDLSIHELRYEIQHALTIGKDEYEDLSEKVKNKSRGYIIATMESSDFR